MLSLKLQKLDIVVMVVVVDSFLKTFIHPITQFTVLLSFYATDSGGKVSPMMKAWIMN